MQVDITVLAVVAAIITLASVIQSSIGFAFALFATPLLLWTGIPLPQVITIVSISSFFSSLVGAGHLRDSIPWRPALTASVVRIAMTLVGLLVLKMLVSLDAGSVRAVVGGILIVLVGMKLIYKARPVDKVHWLWGALAFSSSGLLVGICGMGGPPLVLWLLAHNWSTARVRGFLFVAFAVTIPIQIVLLYLVIGTQILSAALWALLFIPFVLLGTVVGLPLGNRLPKPLLRRIMNGILLVIGISAVLPVLVG